jgi:hypothetical protein
MGWLLRSIVAGRFFSVSLFDRFLPSFFFRAAYLTTGIFSLYSGMDFKSHDVSFLLTLLLDARLVCAQKKRGIIVPPMGGLRQRV